MRKPQSFPSRLRKLDQLVEALREQINEAPDPSATGRAVAAIILDSIARIRAYSDQLNLATGYQLFDMNQTFEEVCGRAYAILRLTRKLDTMLLNQIDCFLKCFGGTEAIMIQQISSLVKEDPVLRDALLAKLLARRSGRRN